MKSLIISLLVLFLIPMPVSAVEFQAPTVPESGKEFMPNETESFADGLWSIVKESISVIKPEIASIARVCFSIIVAIILCSIVKVVPGGTHPVTELVCTIMIGYTLLKPSDALIRLASDTVIEMSNYGKLLLPILTGALAAGGGTSKSAALYVGTVAFNTALCTAVSELIVPMVYIFLCLSVAENAIGNHHLEKIKGFIKWVVTWSLKIVLYLFTGYITITGVVTGSVDASAIKAAKLTISGMVPVVGGLLSDASEAVLISAGLIKNSAGVYGLLATIAVWIGPFLKIGIQYLLLKVCGSFCEVFSVKTPCRMIHDFSNAMGLLLAMIGTVCIILLISIVCFMKGVT